MERVKGIEPSYPAWEAGVLPLNYTRLNLRLVFEHKDDSIAKILSLQDLRKTTASSIHLV